MLLCADKIFGGVSDKIQYGHIVQPDGEEAYPAVMPSRMGVCNCARASTDNRPDTPITHTLLSDHSQRLAVALEF